MSQPPPFTISEPPGLAAVRYAVGVVAFAGAYYLAARVGLLFAVTDSHIAFIWPPAGVALAILFRAGLRFWPGVFLGALAVQLQLFPWWVAAGIAAGKVAGPVVAIGILRRAPFDLATVGRRGLCAFLLAGLAGTNVAVYVTVLGRAVGGVALIDLAPTWVVFWLSDTAGVLIVAPPLLTAVRPRHLGAVARASGWLLLTALLAGAAFTDAVPAAARGLLLFPPFMLLIYVGMSERLRVGSLHVLVVVAIAVVGTAGGEGAFGLLPPLAKLLMLWTVAVTAALIVLATTATLGDRERAEAALAAVAREYQDLVDSTPAAIVRYTPDGTLTFVNETLCRLLANPRELLIGHSVTDFIPDMPRSETVADLPIPHQTSGPATNLSGMIRTPDGSCRWYRWTARRITTAQGRSEFQAVGIDLTERRQAEAERTTLERKMQDTQRLEALGVLAGGVAHDFNNLLAGVLGHAELAAAALPDGHPARDHLATVLSGVAQAGGLTRQLLAYSGKGRFMLRTIDLNALIGQTTDLLRVALPKKVNLILHLERHLPDFTGDDGQIRQVLMNLLINAGEAIGDRAGTVTVTTAAHHLHLDAVSGGAYSPAAPGRFIELIVSDTGCGMDDATKAKLFDPFFTTKFTGRGLGMSAVLGIVRGHGGGIRVDSRAGFGTRFTVLLPVAADSPASGDTTPGPLGPLLRTPHAPRAPRSEPASRPKPRGAASRGLALVVDDEPTVRQVGELMMKQMGYEVLTANNGEEAVALFAAHADRVRVVLLDLMMPVMDGAEALAAIRGRSMVPVILCSGYSAEAVPEELAGDAVTGFLQKPYARGELQTALTALGA